MVWLNNIMKKTKTTVIALIVLETYCGAKSKDCSAYGGCFYTYFESLVF
jgi:hypothetical protein